MTASIRSADSSNVNRWSRCWFSANPFSPEMHTTSCVSLEYSWVYTDAQMCIYVLVLLHFRQDLLQGQKDMESALEHLLENLSPPSVEALPVALMLLPHTNQLDKVLCTS